MNRTGTWIVLASVIALFLFPARYAPAKTSVRAVVPEGAAVVAPIRTEDVAASPDDYRLDVNLATREDLLSLPGIGETLADRILARRGEVGRFSKVEDLLEVSGIGKAKLDAIDDYITVR